MREYYSERFHWIFNYTRRDFLYCLLKTLCVVIGLPIYAVAFVVEMIFTAINMIFCWIPILNVVVTVICKAVVWLFGMTFYINILTDLKEYKATHAVQYEVEDAAAPFDGELVEQPTEEETQEQSEQDENN